MQYIKHTSLTVAVQAAVGVVSQNWLVGGLFMAGYFLGREIAQAEYRWIETYGLGLRANMPWWGRFDSRVWKFTDMLDWILPCLAATCIAVLA